MQLNRKPSLQEKQLISYLVNLSSSHFLPNWEEHLLVCPMSDGGMGSLHLFPEGIDLEAKRQFGQQVSECHFKDKDGVEIIASLNVDVDGNLFELDIWKTDYSPLIDIPNLQV